MLILCLVPHDSPLRRPFPASRVSHFRAPLVRVLLRSCPPLFVSLAVARFSLPAMSPKRAADADASSRSPTPAKKSRITSSSVGVSLYEPG